MKKYLVATLIGILAVAALAVAGCGSSGTTTSSPGSADVKAMLYKFYKAANSEDVASVKMLITASSVNTLDTKPELVIKYEKGGPITVAIDGPVINGNNATVTAKLTQEGNTTTDRLVLSRENGAWKVDLDKSVFSQ